MIRRLLLSVVALLAVAVVSVAAELPIRLPLGLQERAAHVPDDNPLTRDKIALGKQLFWDTRWSRNGTVACVSCHDPGHGWGDARRFSERSDGTPTLRHAPTIVNRLFSSAQEWTGLHASLEEQALHASDQSPELIVKTLGAIRGYRAQFQKAFGTGVTPENVAKAIAAYVRTILSGNSPYDRYRAGDASALSPAERRGLALFEGKARCVRCHAGFNFTDESHHNVGIGMDRPDPDLGRYTVTKRDEHRGAFKTPTLRDATQHPPYFHDGSAASLHEVVEHYDRGGIANPWLSADIVPLHLTQEEHADVVRFLEILTGEVAPEVTTPPALPN